MDSALQTVLFLNRLRALQWLCSDSDPACPKALIFIPGPDGRFNGGSTNIIKYLFKGGVGKELQDETLSEEMDVLEDLVLLVKESSVSVMYSSSMKTLLVPLIENVPYLVEYTYSPEEESDIDKFQLRKCVNFKRMVLEALSDGDGVGMPVPSAYDDIMEVENWPMLQSFAMDGVVCPTGFFTSHYTIADIGPNLDSLFRTVDGFCLDSTLKLTHSMIASHMQQMLSILDTPTVSQRQRLTADDVLGPLHVLFEFGELEAPGVVESLLRPSIWFGAASNDLHAMKKAEGWEDELVGCHKHAVVESSEPSTGMRWCRTYFLATGKGYDLLEELQRLQKLGSDVDEDDFEDLPAVHDLVPADLYADLEGLALDQRAVRRLQALYAKLCLSLRRLARKAFSTSFDVISAATELQTQLTDIMTMDAAGLAVDDKSASLYASLLTPEMVLQGNEYLQIHMDCMNAFGEVVTAEEVEELGGACWIYVRVSVHGVSLGDRELGAVAVGDTFLFSPLASRALATPSDAAKSRCTQTLQFISDHCCVTQPLPYFRNFVGSGVEEVFGRLVQRCVRTSTADLGLGRALEFAGSNTVAAIVLTDHPLASVSRSTLQMFSSGFVIDKFEGITCIPAVVSFERDVERIWAVDLADALVQSLSNAFPAQRQQLVPLAPSLQRGGYMLCVGLRSGSLGATAHRALPVVLSPALAGKDGYIALVVPYEDAGAQTFREVLERWKPAFRVNDIVEHRGSDVRVPTVLTTAMLHLLDERSVAEAPEVPPPFAHLVSVARLAVQESPVPGFGLLPMQCSHALAEAQRLTAFDFQALSDSPSRPTRCPDVATVVVTGLAGCGVDLAARILAAQLKTREEFQGRQVVVTSLDLSEMARSWADEKSSPQTIQALVHDYLGARLGTPPQSAAVHLITVVTTPLLQLRVADLLTMVACLTRHRQHLVMSVCAPGALFLTGDSCEAITGLGFEQWRALGLELVQPHCCDAVVAVEGAGSQPDAYRRLRALLDRVHPEVVLTKLAPHALAFSDDVLLPLISAIVRGRAATCEALLPREARAMTLGQPPALLMQGLGTNAHFFDCSARLFPVSPVLPVMSVRCFTAPAASPWALSAAVRVLTTVLFPDAKTNAFRVTDDWLPPKSSGAQGWVRLMEVAAAKVLQRRHAAAVDEQLAVLLRDPSRMQDLRDLRASVLGVRGHIELHAQRFSASSTDAAAGFHRASSEKVQVEGNRGFIALHEVPSAPGEGSVLELCGVFSCASLALLRTLFEACERTPMEPRALLTVDSPAVQSAQKTIQNMKPFSTRPLPDAVWFDGSFYVDFQGAKREVRPDINALLAEYVQQENGKIRRHNRMVQLCK